MKLPREFYQRDTITVARELLGKILVHRLEDGLVSARITETEAYTGVEDKACHSYGGRRTARTKPLYLEGGHTYVYLIYGIYELFNVVTEPEGVPCAALIRGCEILEGSDLAAQRRFGKPYESLTPAQKRGLLDGPGKLTQGLGISRAQNALDLLGESLYLLDAPPLPTERIGVSKRIGIDYAEEAADFPYRFFLKN